MAFMARFKLEFNISFITYCYFLKTFWIFKSIRACVRKLSCEQTGNGRPVQMQSTHKSILKTCFLSVSRTTAIPMHFLDIWGVRKSIAEKEESNSVICWQIRISFPYMCMMVFILVKFILFISMCPPVTQSISPCSGAGMCMSGGGCSCDCAFVYANTHVERKRENSEGFYLENPICSVYSFATFYDLYIISCFLFAFVWQISLKSYMPLW